MPQISIHIECKPDELGVVLDGIRASFGARPSLAGVGPFPPAPEPLVLDEAAFIAAQAPSVDEEKKATRRGRKSNAEKAAEAADVDAPAHEAPKGGPVVETDNGPVVQTLDELKKDIDTGAFPGTEQTETTAEVRTCTDADVRKAIGVATKPLGFAKVQALLQGYLGEYGKSKISDLTDEQRGVLVTRIEDEAGVKSNV